MGLKLGFVPCTDVGRLVGGSLDWIMEPVNGTGDRDGSEDAISSNVGLIVGLPVIFSIPLIVPAVLLLCIAVTTPTEVLVTRAAISTAAMVTWVATEIPTAEVAAAAIVPAPPATDVPADAEACTAIDWRAELNLQKGNPEKTQERLAHSPVRLNYPSRNYIETLTLQTPRLVGVPRECTR